MPVAEKIFRCAPQKSHNVVVYSTLLKGYVISAYEESDFLHEIISGPRKPGQLRHTSLTLLHENHPNYSCANKTRGGALALPMKSDNHESDEQSPRRSSSEKTAYKRAQKYFATALADGVWPIDILYNYLLDAASTVSIAEAEKWLLLRMQHDKKIGKAHEPAIFGYRKKY